MKNHEAGVAHLQITETDAASIEKPLELRAEGWYLISGGLGGLGLEVGEWLLEQGAGRVILASRGISNSSNGSNGKGKGGNWEKRVTTLQQQYGAERVEAIRMDVGVWSEVIESIAKEKRGQEASGRRLKLRGVIHSAGEVSDAVLLRQERERFEQVMRAKVSGGWNLHYATIDEELDFFLLFSSAAVVFGNPGQSNHAAANSGLDGLAHYRRSRGLPALSINWSAWDEIGAALKSDVGKRAGQQGIMMIKPVQGLHALSQLMRSNKTQIVALPVNWLRWQEGQKHAQTPALLRSVITEALEATGNYSILDENLGTEAIATD
jgi:myxalamid-type polyketide synthase MxaE and MxaD